MGLFDSLPAPSKGQGAAAKRPSDLPPPDDSSNSKKARTDGCSAGSEGPSAAAASSLPCTPIVAAFSEDKGSRLTMEDIAVINYEAGPSAAEGSNNAAAGGAAAAAAGSGPGGVRLSFLAIFDGHGGSAVARYAADHLHTAVLRAGLAAEADRLAAAGADSTEQQQPLPQPNIKQCKAAITEGFRELDRQVLEQCAAAGWPDGCTAVVLWVLGDTAFVANVGDARCVLARAPAPAAAAATAAVRSSAPAPAPASNGQDGQAHEGSKKEQPQQGGTQAQQADGTQRPQADQQQEAQQGPVQQAQQQQQQQQVEPLKAITLTREHKAIFPQERQRIEKAGSFVSADGRLAGRIEVSRAFGDRQFKKSGMSAVPDIQAFQISRRDAFLLLACDGFWGVFSPQDAVDFAQHELRGKGNSTKQTCNRLIYEAIRERKCKDNCTVMLVEIQHPPASS